MLRRVLGGRRGWLWIVTAGFAVLITGVISGLRKAGALCGSPLIPESRAAERFDALHPGSSAAAACYRTIESAAALTWLIIVLGVVLVLAGVILRILALNRFNK